MKAVQLLLDCLTLKIEAVNFLQMPATIYQETQHHIPIGLNLQQHHCDYLKCQSDTDVVLWLSSYCTQNEHLQLITLTLSGAMEQGYW